MKKLLGLFGPAALLLMAGCAHHPHQYHHAQYDNQTWHYNQMRHQHHGHRTGYQCGYEHYHSKSGYLVPTTRNIQY